MTALALFVLLASTSAQADTFAPRDLLLASQRGLPASTQQLIASGIAEPSAVQKACLIAGGVSEAIVAEMVGPAPATLKPDEQTAQCAEAGLEALELSTEQRAHAAKAQQAYAVHQARVEHSQRVAELAECIPIDSPKMQQTGEATAEELEAWIEQQVMAGRSEIASFSWTTSMSYSGSGGGSTKLIVCAWAEGLEDEDE